MQEPDLDRNIRDRDVKRAKGRKTAKWVGIFTLLFILLWPLIVLMELLETAYALVVVVAVFGLSIAGYRIYQGQYGWITAVCAIASFLVLLLHFVIAPLVKRTDLYKSKKKRLGF